MAQRETRRSEKKDPKHLDKETANDRVHVILICCETFLPWTRQYNQNTSQRKTNNGNHKLRFLFDNTRKKTEWAANKSHT